jgi:hypothetical protein
MVMQATSYSAISPPQSSNDPPFPLGSSKILMTLMYLVIGGVDGHGHELLILGGKLIINLRRERVAGNMRVKASHLSRGLIKLF